MADNKRKNPRDLLANARCIFHPNMDSQRAVEAREFGYGNFIVAARFTARRVAQQRYVKRAIRAGRGNRMRDHRPLSPE